MVYNREQTHHGFMSHSTHKWHNLQGDADQGTSFYIHQRQDEENLSNAHMASTPHAANGASQCQHAGYISFHHMETLSCVLCVL